jgi:nicotinate-nucleotide adenylyltransferase
MKVGLFFGTFNPIHVGHLTIANHLTEYSNLDQVWFVVTPHSPFKNKDALLPERHRLEMVYLATEDYDKLKESNIEFKLPQPNYTINTLDHLAVKYPDNTFCLIMGEDNLKGFHKWKDYELILKRYNLYVYPRISEGQVESKLKDHKSIKYVDAPIMELSSTFIRNSIKEGKLVRPMLPEPAWIYLDEMSFYKK